MAKLAESGRIWPIWPPRGGLVLARGGPDPARGGPESGPGGSRIGSQKSGPSPRKTPKKFPEFGSPGHGSRIWPKSDYDRYPGLRSRMTEYNLSHPHRICANSGVRNPESGGPESLNWDPPWPEWSETQESGHSGRIWPNLAESGRIWPNLAESGRIWPNLAESGQIWPNLAKSAKSGQILAFWGIFPKYVSLNTPKYEKSGQKPEKSGQKPEKSGPETQENTNSGQKNSVGSYGADSFPRAEK